MKQPKKVLNFINFVRGTDSLYDHETLLTALRNELQYLKDYGIRSTVLLQYDALNDKDFRDLIEEYSKDGMIEVGLWIELVRSAYINAGVEWKGRDMEWDWIAEHCTLLGQTPQNRIKLIDEIMRAFKEHYGYYPSVVGQWVIDTFSLRYMSEKYGVEGFCMCKDQDGTDTFTLWGGYLFGAYYPSKDNMYVPAQNIENQINAPIFRMLGSDPIYQYDMELSVENGPQRPQSVMSLEPVYLNRGGGLPKWVDWYLKENFNDKALNFAYAQAGQENSFSWPRISRGYPYQVEKISELIKAGELEVLQFGETVKWFKDTYKQTPPTSSIAESDWKEEGRKTYWYENKNYRINLHKENERVWIRDWYIFDERYHERYLDKALDTRSCNYDNLPVVDGYRWTGNGIRSGIYFKTEEGEEIVGETVYDKTEHGIVLSIVGEQGLKCCFEEDKIEFIGEKDFSLKWDSDDSARSVEYKIDAESIVMEYNGFVYKMAVESGLSYLENGKPIIKSVNGKIVLKIVR